MKFLLSRVEQAIGDGTSLSGTVLDRSGASGGDLEYTPGASL